MAWLREFKLAVIEKNPKNIKHLLEQTPELETLEEMQEALYLTKEAYLVMQEAKEQTLLQMQQLKKNIDFLESTQKAQKNSLDISM